MAGRGHLTSEVWSGDPEEPPRARGQGRQLGGATHAEARASGREEQPEEQWLQAQEDLEELSQVEGQERWQ